MKTPEGMLRQYLELRRSLGFKLTREESRLRAFLAFIKSK